MKKTIPLKKQQKRAQREFYSAQRGTWNGITPTTRVVESKRVYNRKRLSREDRLSRFLCCRTIPSIANRISKPCVTGFS